MAYLICMVHRDYPTTETNSEIVVSKRYPLKAPEYADIREALEEIYPSKTVFSPLDYCPNGLVHSCYVSKTKDSSSGRIAANFQLWSVK